LGGKLGFDLNGRLFRLRQKNRNNRVIRKKTARQVERKRAKAREKPLAPKKGLKLYLGYLKEHLRKFPRDGKTRNKGEVSTPAVSRRLGRGLDYFLEGTEGEERVSMMKDAEKKRGEKEELKTSSRY